MSDVLWRIYSDDRQTYRQFSLWPSRFLRVGYMESITKFLELQAENDVKDLRFKFTYSSLVLIY